MELTNLNLNCQKLQSAVTRSKLENFDILKLMLAGKPTILHKMVPFKNGENDFKIFAKLNRRKFNIVRVKAGKQIS